MTFPKCLAVENQRAKGDKVLWSEFDKWRFGAAVIELLNLLLFQMMFASSQPYVWRARERSLEASDRGHAWVTAVLNSTIEVSQLEQTPRAGHPLASGYRAVSGRIPKAHLKESEDAVSKCLLLASGYLASDKWRGRAPAGGFEGKDTYKQSWLRQLWQRQKWNHPGAAPTSPTRQLCRFLHCFLLPDLSCLTSH